MLKFNENILLKKIPNFHNLTKFKILLKYLKSKYLKLFNL